MDILPLEFLILTMKPYAFSNRVRIRLGYQVVASKEISLLTSRREADQGQIGFLGQMLSATYFILTLDADTEVYWHSVSGTPTQIVIRKA